MKTDLSRIGSLIQKQGKDELIKQLESINEIMLDLYFDKTFVNAQKVKCTRDFLKQKVDGVGYAKMITNEVVIRERTGNARRLVKEIIDTLK